MHKRATLVAALFCLWASGCEKGGKDDLVTVQPPVRINEQKLQEHVDNAKAELTKQREAFAAESKKQLDVLDEKIAELKARASTKTEAASDELMATLKEKREEARKALESAQSASADKWESVKSRARDALGKAEQSYDEALQKLKRD